MEETEYFLTSYEFENLHRAPWGSNYMLPDEKHVRIILLRVRNVLLASLKYLIRDMEETEGFLAS